MFLCVFAGRWEDMSKSVVFVYVFLHGRREDMSKSVVFLRGFTGSKGGDVEKV